MPYSLEDLYQQVALLRAQVDGLAPVSPQLLKMTLHDDVQIGYPIALADGQVLTWVAAAQAWENVPVVSGAPSGVIAGTYGDATHVAQFTVSASGDLTFAQNVAISDIDTGGGGGGGLAIYGDGSDGTQTFDGSTTILGIAPSGNTYTLNRDVFLAAGTINSGITVITNNFRTFCAGTLTNNGTISWNGHNATGSAAGALLNNSSGSLNSAAGASAPGTAGGAGQTGAGSLGTNSTAGGSLGGVGGTAGSGPSGGGGAGGTLPGWSSAKGHLRSVPTAVIGMGITNGGGLQPMQGGSGGGGGGGDGTNAGGGGGGGGGVVVVVAKAFAGTGNIQARGGNGGNPAAGNTGGGGGGGGGVLIVVSGSVSGGAITGQTCDANGGLKGTHLGSGVDGNNGSAGTLILLPN